MTASAASVVAGNVATMTEDEQSTSSNEPYYDGIHGYPVSRTRDPEEKSKLHQQAGRIGAHMKWAMEDDRSAATQPARDGFMRKFELQVDPNSELPVDERAKRADSARRAHFQRLAMKSAKVRRERRRGGGAAIDRRDDGA